MKCVKCGKPMYLNRTAKGIARHRDIDKWCKFCGALNHITSEMVEAAERERMDKICKVHGVKL